MRKYLSIIKYFAFILLSTPFLSNAQDMKAVKSNIKTLCSNNFYGRGYTFNADKKAASFIGNEFKEIGVIPFPGQSSYFQEYNLDINTFPEASTFKINNKKLKLGVDYIPAGDAGKGAYEKADWFILDDAVFNDDQLLKAFIKEDLAGKVVCYDEQHERTRFNWNRALHEKIMQAEAVVVLYDDKLTFSQNRWQLPKPRFYVSRQALPEDINTVSFDISPQFYKDYTSQNVIGYIPGKNKDKYIVFSAHYDHLGSIGKKCYFPGANDNASGISMLIELAKYYKQHPPNYSVVFIGFGSEEAGLIGSAHYVEHPLFPLKNIEFLINLDLFGSGEEGVMAVNGKIFTEQYDLLRKINDENKYLTAVLARGKAANSDHYFFSENGVPSFFFYLMGKSWTHYHDIYDAPPLPLSDFSNAYQLITNFSNALMLTE